MANDSDMVMARYKHPNRGQHTVVGPVTKIKYGFRAGGDVFLVHKDDVRTQPHLYEEIETKEAAAPVKAPPAPPSEALPEPEAVAALEDTTPPADVITGDSPPTRSINIVGRLPGVTAPIAEQLDADGIETADQVLELGIEGLTKYTGIGKVKAEAIIEAIGQLQEMAERA
jgi:hypothetical protein